MAGPFDANALLDIGLRDIGARFRAEGQGRLDERLDGAHLAANRPLLDEAPALYAFVQGERVVYIGKTARALRDRLGGYRNPGRSQRTNGRCNEEIREEVAAGRPVRLLVFCPSPQVARLRDADFAIDLPAGLENALIAAFEPPWNGRDRGATLAESAEREEGGHLRKPSGALVPVVIRWLICETGHSEDVIGPIWFLGCAGPAA